MSDLSDKLQDLQDELIVTGCYYRQNKFTTRVLSIQCTFYLIKRFMEIFTYAYL